MSTSAITAAASVLLARGPQSPELFLVKRGEQLRFFGGFWAFPGGKLAGADCQAPWSNSGQETSARTRERGAAAARELFEETGILVARRPDRSFPNAGAELDRLRRELLAENITFSQVLADLNLLLCPDDFVLIGDVTTPAFALMRFETTFFVANLPPGQVAEVWPGELDEGRWSSAAGMLDSWIRGECFLSPPTIMTLEAILGRPVEEAPARLGPLFGQLEKGKIHPIYFSPRVQMVPLKTMALAPSTHTNAYLIGSGPIYLLDPGPDDPAEQQRLFDVVDEHARAGRRLSAIVLTHHHPDHIGAVAACAARYQVPVWAHPWTANAVRGRIDVSKTILDGERLDLGAAPDGAGPWHLEAMHTPGHAPGHLAFYEPHYRLLFVGDMVSTVSSVVIAPPEGDLTLYLLSLERLRSLDCRLLLPAHGNVSARPKKTIEECLQHRSKREEQLLETLAAGPRTIDDLGPELYKGLPAPLMRFAKYQILAGLLKLERQGIVEKKGREPEQTWRLRSGQAP